MTLFPVRPFPRNQGSIENDYQGFMVVFKSLTVITAPVHVNSPSVQVEEGSIWRYLLCSILRTPVTQLHRQQKGKKKKDTSAPFHSHLDFLLLRFRCQKSEWSLQLKFCCFRESVGRTFQGYGCRCNGSMLRLHQPTFNKRRTRLCSLFFPPPLPSATCWQSFLSVVWRWSPQKTAVYLFILKPVSTSTEFFFLGEDFPLVVSRGQWMPDLHFTVCQCSHFIVKDITTLILPPTVGLANCWNITWQLASQPLLTANTNCLKTDVFGLFLLWQHLGS